MKRLLRLIKNNNLEVRLEYIAKGNEYGIAVLREGKVYLMSLDAFDVSREYSERELCDLICECICNHFGIEESFG